LLNGGRTPAHSDGYPFDADMILVNGKVYPFLNGEPRKYRFRILNASNSRILTLKLDSDQPFYQIGTDGGLLETTIKINEFILTSAERVDVIIDFSPYYGQTITLKNVTKSASPETTDVMQFRVTVPLRSTDTSFLPFHLVDFQILDRQHFDASYFQKTGNLIFTGPPSPGVMCGIVTFQSMKITK
jgi:spore coat protein A